MIPKINSAHGSETRNLINRVIETLNRLGIDVQTLVAEGQLTEDQYAKLIKEVNGLIAKGEVSLDDLDPEVLRIFNEVKPEFNLLSIPRVGSVDESKTTFIKTSHNLIDESKSLKNHAIGISDNGIPQPNPTNSVTDFISVDPGEYITVNTQNDGHRFILYGLNYEYIDNIHVPNDPATFKVPDNVYKIRLNINVTKEGIAQANRGKALLPYSKYENPKLDGVHIGSLPTNIVTSSSIGENQVNTEHTSFIKVSSNLIDIEKATPNVAITATSNGDVVSNVSNSVSEYISVKPNEKYTLKTANSHRVAYYNSSKNWISTEHIESDTETAAATLTTPSDAAFIRTNIHITYKEPQINKGDKLLSYEPYYKKLDDDITAVTSGESVTSNEHRIVETELQYSSPLTDDVTADSGNHLRQYVLQDFYDLYDDLVSRFPDYVSMEVLGLDDDGKEIRRYDFKPADAPVLDNKIPKILITTGTHGYERVPIWSAFQMFKQICEDWSTNTILEKLRWNVHFVIIPVVNPYALAKHQRKTRNGVDIQRNFPVSWDLGPTDPEGSTYRGSEPLSEIETQYVYDVFESESNWIHVVDYHNFFSDPDEDRILWVGATDEKTTAIGQKFLRDMTGQLKRENEWFLNNNSILGFSNLMKTGIYWYAQSKGVSAVLFESIQTIPREPNALSYSQNVMKLGVDSFTRWLYLVYLNYK